MSSTAIYCSTVRLFCFSCVYQDNRGVAQGLAHLLREQGVGGSNPLAPTRNFRAAKISEQASRGTVEQVKKPSLRSTVQLINCSGFAMLDRDDQSGARKSRRSSAGIQILSPRPGKFRGAKFSEQAESGTAEQRNSNTLPACDLLVRCSAARKFASVSRGENFRAGEQGNSGAGEETEPAVYCSTVLIFCEVPWSREYYTTFQ